MGAAPLRLVVKIRRQGAGWTATFDSIDQRATDIPVDTVVLDGDRVVLGSSKLQARFEARLAGDRLAGIFSQRGVELPLVLTKTASPPTVRPRPQEPVRPLPYDEIALVVDNAAGHNQLACTLTKPRGAGPFPAVVLITGSGAQDRDESLMGHKPFLVLSDAITRRGIAVLRCDDRGTAKSTGDFATATTFDFAGDTAAELAALCARPDVDPRHLGVVGHSEGAMIGPMVAAASKDVKFIVLLAPPAVPGEQTLYLQSAAMAKAGGATDAQIAAQTALLREVYAVVTSAKDGPAAAKELRARYAALPEAERRAFEQQKGLVEAQIKEVTSPWFRAFLTLDPRVYLRQLEVPVLALQGERDLQVLPQTNLPELRQALGGKPDVTIREMPGLNHLFQACRSCLPDEYGRIDETMSPTVLGIVTDWLSQHTRSEPTRASP